MILKWDRAMKTVKEYSHLPLNMPMDMGAASYWISVEDRLPFRGREVLCVVRDTDCITSCCGQTEGFRSLGVLGYIVEWRTRIAGRLPVSMVEPITDMSEKEELTRALRQKYRIDQVEFL